MLPDLIFRYTLRMTFQRVPHASGQSIIKITWMINVSLSDDTRIVAGTGIIER